MGGVPVTIIASGGRPVTDVDGAIPVTSAPEGVNGGQPVTLLSSGGEPVTFVADDLTRDPQVGGFHSGFSEGFF